MGNRETEDEREWGIGRQRMRGLGIGSRETEDERECGIGSLRMREDGE